MYVYVTCTHGCGFLGGVIAESFEASYRRPNTSPLNISVFISLQRHLSYHTIITSKKINNSISHIQCILKFPHLSQAIIAWKSVDFGDEEKWEEACLNFLFHKMRISVVPT